MRSPCTASNSKSLIVFRTKLRPSWEGGSTVRPAQKAALIVKAVIGWVGPRLQQHHQKATSYRCKKIPRRQPCWVRYPGSGPTPKRAPTEKLWTRLQLQVVHSPSFSKTREPKKKLCSYGTPNKLRYYFLRVPHTRPPGGNQNQPLCKHTQKKAYGYASLHVAKTKLPPPACKHEVTPRPPARPSVRARENGAECVLSIQLIFPIPPRMGGCMTERLAATPAATKPSSCTGRLKLDVDPHLSWGGRKKKSTRNVNDGAKAAAAAVSRGEQSQVKPCSSNGFAGECITGRWAGFIPCLSTCGM